MKYGLTVPYVTKWEGLGTDARGNPIRLLLDSSIIDNSDAILSGSSYSSNFITYADPSGYTHYDGEITYPVFKYLDSGELAWRDYLYYDMNDAVAIEEDGSTNYYTIRDFMFKYPEIDVFSKLVYSNKNVIGTYSRSSIVYYNNFKNAIDTIIKGLSLSISVNSQASNLLDVNDWDKYRISFISSPSRPEGLYYPLEVIINENTKTILIVWYQGNDDLNYNRRFSSRVSGKGIMGDDGNIFEFKSFVDGSVMFSHWKTPYYVNNASIIPGIVNFYGDHQTYGDETSNSYSQLNWNPNNGINSQFSPWAANVVNAGGVFLFTKQYNTFAQSVDYSYLKNPSTKGDFVRNYGYTYFNLLNYYSDKTLSLELLKELLLFNNIGYYILRGTQIFSNMDFEIPPINIVINPPREYSSLDSDEAIYTYNGWFRPKFNNILNFNGNETQEIINIVKGDFTFANTSLLSYNNIPQLWYNEVTETVTAEDVSTANAINYQKHSMYSRLYGTRDILYWMEIPL
ncbi:MAG: hypothetical protein HC831_22600 [Chloroflexia bacterium]|nr:hypothetical protein [Chloroflexia bacterium]